MNTILAPHATAGMAKPVVFLAGSIDMGRAAPWQQRLVQSIDDLPGTALNPRRENWAPAREDMQEQVSWELAGLECADVVVFCFDPGGQAPITLLELGLTLGRAKRAIVLCPEGYWRRDNVLITAARYGATVCEDWDGFVAALRTALADPHGLGNEGA